MFGFAVLGFAALLNVAGSVVYIRDILYGAARPNRVTWLMWSVAPLIGTIIALFEGVRWSVLPVFMAGFCPFMVFCASFLHKGGYWQLGRFDWACGALSALALAFWLFTGQPLLALALAITSDAFATAPTLAKAWMYPESESSFAFVTGLINGLASFVVINEWTFAAYAFPMYIVLAYTLILCAMYRRRVLVYVSR
jgi:hypothetical protein